MIDPGGDPDDILSMIREAGFALKAILLTHGHYDHTGGVAGLEAAFPARRSISTAPTPKGSTRPCSRRSPGSPPLLRRGRHCGGGRPDCGGPPHPPATPKAPWC